MKINQLKEKIETIPSGADDFDLEIFIGHASYEVGEIHVANFGKSVSLHAYIEGEKSTWTKELPKESGSYWWWNSDEDSNPIHIELGKSLPSGPVFAQMGQYGWTQAQDVEEMGGWWMPLLTPDQPTL